MKNRIAFTLVEIMIGLALCIILLFAVYRLFFAEVRSIRKALEHISVNENVRLFLTRFGNDVRNANWLDFPTPTVREGVPRLLPALEGPVCGFTTQVFDFSIKPPDPKFLKEIKIVYRIKKTTDGTYDILRDIDSEVPETPGGQGYSATRKVCGGLKEIYVFSEIKKPVKFNTFPGLTFKNFLVYEPYDIDGTGPYLVHVRATFVRQSGSSERIKDENPFTIRTCYAIRGRMNGVNP